MLKIKAQKIKLLIFDVDGVLTDGMLNYGPDGELFKQFNVKDGVGIKLLEQQGVNVAVITAKDSRPLSQRMNDLSVQYFYPACNDKIIAFNELLDTLSLNKEQVAYVGDDVIDLPVMEQVGLAIAVQDAHDFVKKTADYITVAKGGQGVAREVADLILDAQFNLDKLYTQMAKGKKGKIVQ
ncbi:MAG: HAD-IIIA family hydrolase [gamma proteobacterium symbiont of Bathyaustriella thionipta]|nr:HAD-IIIA family hydrolase [gamma proteobacterium symbiont of Bathyaustriella thionipta]MCU7951012.1 HAD-IIIA family hydrolase [gamma proteobacterium symbiont of Bathyaustriella thionipta]MCU7953947.1 HAD-IIIA family hydrolase [gamma proteobacterium symbiont of Bathyaustriella thionipta]MCU7957516.1 HAD-IIIA family hydrolase [gamma proteobacterium symbiont of Bathyaustriella thionipta]MCU7968340.1 HAD-IIIA family hydrolase [gamma proteobacterium symbiont of Bathyaustriella thionipta]